MATPEDNETIVDRELTKARAHDPEPPAWFVATVMRRVHAWESGQSFWRRWRRSAKAANFSPAPRVGMAGVSIHSGGLAMKKVVWTVATLGALAIAAYVWLGYPSVGQGTDATIGAAQRYQAQPTPAAAPAADSSVQAFLQTDTFDRIVKNPDTRHALQKAVSDPAFRKAMTEQSLIALLARQEMQVALQREIVRSALGQDAFLKAAAEGNFQRSALEPALIKAVQEAGLEAAVAADASYRALFANVAARDGLIALAARGAFQDALFVRAIGDADLLRAMRMSAFDAALSQGVIASYVQER